MQKKKCNTEKFIQKSKEIYGEKYNYSKVNYVNKSTKVCIIDKDNGEFWQTPETHFKKGKKHHFYNTEKFIEKAKEIHGDKYDYSKTEYVDMHTKVCIICPIHGEFWQKANDHLKGHGCMKCCNTQRLTKEEFVEKSRAIHGNKYDYSKVDYKNNRTKVCIICPEHGEFWQIPNAHLQGVGCPQCGYRKQNCELKIAEILKNNGIKYKRHAKFEWLGRQNLDFYLPDFNIAIEYQGLQHFKPIKFYGGEKSFNKTIERDNRKYTLCKENNIKLMYVSFEKELPKTYLDEIYTNENELIKNIKEYVNH